MIFFPVGGEQEYNASLVEYINTDKNFSKKRHTILYFEISNHTFKS